MPATRSELRDRAKRRADMENSSFVSDTEWNDYINEGLSELHDIVINKHDDHIVSSTTLTFTNGASTTALPSDFYRIRGVDLTSGGFTYALEPFMFRERNRLQFASGILYGIENYMYQVVGDNLHLIPKAQGSVSVTLWYIPEAPELAADGTEVNVGYAQGWDRYVVLYATIRALQKEESDVSSHFAELGALQKRIEASAMRSSADGKRVVDVKYKGSAWYRGGS